MEEDPRTWTPGLSLAPLGPWRPQLGISFLAVEARGFTKRNAVLTLTF